jgi:hypothetical protein
MIIDATYEHGAIKLPNGLTFRHDYFKVKIEVADQELINVAEQVLPAVTDPEQKKTSNGSTTTHKYHTRALSSTIG